MAAENRQWPDRRRRRTKGEIDPAVAATWSPKDRQREEMHRNLELALAEAGLPVRVVNTMEANGVFQVKDLLEEDGEDLINTPNLGEKTLKEIIECVKALNLEPPRSWIAALYKSPTHHIKKRKK